MTRFPISSLSAASALAFGLCVSFTVQTVAQDAVRTEIPLKVSELPSDVWAKNRLAPETAGDGLRMVDKEEGPFNDASFWQVKFDRDLPYGRKYLSFSIDVGAGHEALWGASLMQPILDGKEAAPALDEGGRPSFEKIVAEDGKGFIPVPKPGELATITLQIPKEARRLGTFAFMTAGAKGFDMTLSDFKVVVWPEEDDRVFPQNPVATSLGFPPGHPRVVAIEWQGLKDAPDSVDVTLTGPDGERTIPVSLPLAPSTASGSRVSRVDLGSLDLVPGRYTLDVPKLGERSEAASTTFEVSADDAALRRMRDEAWGAFHWITGGPTGPYPDAHTQDVAAKVFGSEETRDVSGGWYDAGDYGKYAVNGSWAVTLMLLTGLNAPDALAHPIDPLSGGTDKPDWIDVAVAQLDWLVKMQGPDGGVNHKATTRDWPALGAAPTDDKAVKFLMPVSSTATADFAAVMALGAKVLAAYDTTRAARFEAAAANALEWLEKNPDLVMIERLYDGKEYGGPYMDDDDADERFLALAAWAALKRTPEAITAAEKLVEARRATLNETKNDTYWGKVDLLGMWALRSIRADLSEEAASRVDGALRSAAHKWRILQQRSAWDLPMADDQGFPWGSNGALATIGWHWLLWSDASGDNKYVEAARAMLPYFHGRNPLGQTYVTNAAGVRAPHLRPFTSGTIDLPPGFIAGGPNSIDLAGDPAGGAILGRPPMRMYVDDKESYATNEVAINWQAAWALYASLLVTAQ